MNARRHYKTLAIVLRTLDYGESDRIITFYTADFGKVTGIAKGARRSSRRFVNALEPFSSSQILFSRKGYDTLALINACDIINHHPDIREDLGKTLIASSMVELIDQFTMEGKENAKLFTMLHDFLALLDVGKGREGLLHVFALKLLMLTGYEPVLDHCLLCKTPLSRGGGEPYRFSPGGGGIMCKSCYGSTPDAVPVSLGTLKTLLLGKEIAPEKISRLAFSARTALESEQLLCRFMVHLLGKELKTFHVANEIRRMGI